MNREEWDKGMAARRSAAVLGLLAPIELETLSMAASVLAGDDASLHEAALADVKSVGVSLNAAVEEFKRVESLAIVVGLSKEQVFEKIGAWKKKHAEEITDKNFIRKLATT